MNFLNTVEPKWHLRRHHFEYVAAAGTQAQALKQDSSKTQLQ
jgi:hypothetical protein